MRWASEDQAGTELWGLSSLSPTGLEESSSNIGVSSHAHSPHSSVPAHANILLTYYLLQNKALISNPAPSAPIQVFAVKASLPGTGSSPLQTPGSNHPSEGHPSLCFALKGVRNKRHDCIPFEEGENLERNHRK